MPIPTTHREPLCPSEVLPLPGQCPALPQSALPDLHSSYWLRRQTKHLPTSWFSLVCQVFAGCHESLLVDGLSRHYLYNLCIGAWIHTPPCSLSAHTHFFLRNINLTFAGTRSAHGTIPAIATSAGSRISRLQSFVYLQAPILARPSGCSHHISGRPGLIHHA